MRKTFYSNFETAVGNTPIFYWGKYKEAEIFIKLEGENPTGSLKDRTAKFIIEDIKERNLSNNKKILLDTSSGSFGCALSYFGMLSNYPVKVIVNSKASEATILFMEMCGAKVVRYGNITKHGYEHCLELVKKEPNQFIFTDQLNNWNSPKAHYSGTGPEIISDIPEAIAIVASMGSGATLLGISRYLKKTKHNTMVFASIAKPGRKITGTYSDGDYLSPFIKELKEQNYIKNSYPIGYNEAVESARKLIKKGFMVGPQTGGVFLATIKAIEEYNLKGKVVAISGDSGWKNMDKLSENLK